MLIDVKKQKKRESRASKALCTEAETTEADVPRKSNREAKIGTSDLQ
jgi:hypothetical protein